MIDTYGPVSRITLSKYAHLAPASITKIVRELMEAHLVGETKYQENGLRGRPAIGVVVETQAWHFLSLHISHGSISLSLRELSSKLVVEDTVPLPSQASLPLLTRLIAVVDGVFTCHQRQLERLTAIAVTGHGARHYRRAGRYHTPHAVVRCLRYAAGGSPQQAYRRAGLPAT